jgi:hypothetical protein
MPANSDLSSRAGALTATEVRDIVGATDDRTIAAILELDPTRAEVEEAVVWAVGGDEAMRAELHGLSGKVEAIYELLTAESEVEEER